MGWIADLLVALVNTLLDRRLLENSSVEHRCIFIQCEHISQEEDSEGMGNIIVFTVRLSWNIAYDPWGRMTVRRWNKLWCRYQTMHESVLLFKVCPWLVFMNVCNLWTLHSSSFVMARQSFSLHSDWTHQKVHQQNGELCDLCITESGRQHL